MRWYGVFSYRYRLACDKNVSKSSRFMKESSLDSHLLVRSVEFEEFVKNKKCLFKVLKGSHQAAT